MGDPLAAPEALLDLIQSIYACASDPAQWPDTLQRIATVIRAEALSLMVQDVANLQGSLTHNFNVDPYFDRQYNEYFATRNVWIGQGADSLTIPGAMLFGEQVVSNSELRRSEFYQDFLRPQNYLYSMGGTITFEATQGAYLTAQRTPRAGAFGPAEGQFIQLLLPHLRGALKLHQRIAGLELRLDQATAAADRLPQALFVVAADGRLQWMNRLAEILIAAGDGISLGIDGIRATEHAAHQRLRSLILEAAATVAGNDPAAERCPGGALSIPRPSGRAAFRVMVTPLRSQAAGTPRQPAAAVFVSALEFQQVPSEAILQAMLKFTRAEARLACALVQGRTLQEFAQEAGISMNTVRTHLKRVFAKAGVVRQADLIRLVMSLTPGSRDSS